MKTQWRQIMGGGGVRCTLYLRADVKKALQQEAKASGKSMSLIVTEALFQMRAKGGKE